MLPARQRSAICAALFAVAATFAPGESARAREASATCEDVADVAVLSSPLAAWKGAPLRVVVAAERPLDGELQLIAPDGSVAAKSQGRFGGPPYSWFAEVAQPAAGTWKAVLARGDGTCAPATREIEVKRKQPGGPRQAQGSVWPIRLAWTRETENLYSAWIEKLFDAPLEESLSWKALHDVLRDRSRNVLFNHLGLREDEKGLIIRPDCADLPYFLRAYFAFKMGLPFGYSKCTRGGGGRAPKCSQWWNIQKEEPPPAPPPSQEVASGGSLFAIFDAPNAAPPPSAFKLPAKPKGLVPGFGYYMRTTIANAVHSGNGRTAADDDDTDYYPVSLTQETLRPGTIYADPYGHVLVLTRRVPQTDASAGVFLAVDGQPDGTIARKRFWRGNFLFAQDPALGSPGFKRFRPVMRGKGGLRHLTNAEIAKHPEYGDFSLDQSKLGIEDFFDRMDDVMSPEPLDPERALKEAIAALDEQVNARVTSVENGRKYQTGGGAEVAIPDGPSIFETTGAWEDFATPSRDLRLLIAIDVVRGFPDRVARRPERYAMPSGKSAADVRTELDGVLASELSSRRFSYTRSDGSPWTLTLKDIVDRTPALEMAYNINDCVELRWGAADGSDESTTCKRRASDAQRKRMAAYRPWFNERRRPPRQ